MTSDEFDHIGKEIRNVATLGHTGEEPFHAVDEYGGRCGIRGVRGCELIPYGGG